MTEQPQTPEQWEDHYLQQLQYYIQQNTNYLTQINQQSVMGIFAAPVDYNVLLNQEVNFQHYLDGYDKTAAWFVERKLYRLSNYLKLAKDDLAKAVGIIQNIIQQAQAYHATAMNTAQVNYQQNNSEMLKMYDDMNKKWQQTYQKSNDAWDNYIRS